VDSILDRNLTYLQIICLVTIYPAFVGWLGLTGFGIAWSMALRARHATKSRYTVKGFFFSRIVSRDLDAFCMNCDFTN